MTYFFYNIWHICTVIFEVLYDIFHLSYMTDFPVIYDRFFLSYMTDFSVIYDRFFLSYMTDFSVIFFLSYYMTDFFCHIWQIFLSYMTDFFCHIWQIFLSYFSTNINVRRGSNSEASLLGLTWAWVPTEEKKKKKVILIFKIMNVRGYVPATPTETSRHSRSSIWLPNSFNPDLRKTRNWLSG